MYRPHWFYSIDTGAPLRTVSRAEGVVIALLLGAYALMIVALLAAWV
ncbi:hypothetical protein [Devosia soli]|nr:hypothetical protein [Devosia soli]